MSPRLRRATLALALLASLDAPLGANAAPTPAADTATPAAPQATPSGVAEDPAMTARAKEWLHRAQTATLDRSQLDAAVNKQLTDALAKQIAQQMGTLGEPSSFAYVETKSFAPNTLRIYKVVFKSDTLYWFFSTNDAGKITGFRLMPQPPPE